MFTTQYDPLIQAAAAKHLPQWPWQYLRAQIAQESDFNPLAENQVSHCKGLAQFEDETFAEVGATLKFPPTASPFDPEYAIPAMAYYMGWLRGEWHAPQRSETDRWKLCLASYDAGLEHILDAQRLSGGLLGFGVIISYLPAITGAANALETRTYVDRIAAYASQMGAPNG